ncbi:MAG: hypothetical protein HQL59_08545 [Magnetococcales bacterium]|nr:hypothetical protein [Magnetococcales bacterium]
MRLFLISGTHSRHLFLLRPLLQEFEVTGVLVMGRESLTPVPPQGIPARDRDNFIRHFGLRAEVEQRVFGDLEAAQVFASVPSLMVAPEALNTSESARFVADHPADVAVIFGPDLIFPPLYDALPEHKWNVHLGLSPWYRGSATLFWPFFNMEPQYAGATIHQIIAEPDAGAVLHQCVPPCIPGDGLHDVGSRCVVTAAVAVQQLLRLLVRQGSLAEARQRSSGRLYLSSQFRPEHLRVNYDLFNDRMVDALLAGDLRPRPPRLMQPNGPLDPA